MLKTTSAAGPTNLEQGGQGIQVEDQDEKEPAQKSRKGQKTTKSKRPKKPRHPELRTSANQDRFLPLILGGPLPNWGKRSLKLQY